MTASPLCIRTVSADDDAILYTIIRQALQEYGADVPGTAWSDPHLKSMSSWYSGAGIGYWVVEHQGEVVGGCGIAPLAGGKPEQCELQKMYLSPTARGLGLGKGLALAALKHAQEMGYQFCYLETLPNMHLAIGLYERLGFVRLDLPLGNTGHHHCDVCYGLELADAS
jgi:putative acetyltransferase